jgi:secretion/DNA translocation related CpaE-like protein
MSSPLILTRHDTLLDDLLRLVAASGSTPEVVADPGAAVGSWGSASLVLVGVDVADELARLDLPRRDGVHLVGSGRLPDEAFRAAVRIGAENVAELPRSEAWLLETLAEAADGVARHGIAVGVVGGSGGSGATTLACALAMVAARSLRSCVVDTDPQGPGLDRVLGMDGADGVRWDALQQTTGRISARSLREALPRHEGLGVLTWSPGAAGGLAAFAAREAVAAAVRGHDLVCLDLPRSGAVAAELRPRCDHLLVTVRPTVPGLASASRVAAEVSGAGPVSLLVRGAGVDPARVARAVGAPVLAAMPDQRGLDEAVDLGLGPLRSRRGALARAAAQVLEALLAEGARGRWAA